MLHRNHICYALLPPQSTSVKKCVCLWEKERRNKNRLLYRFGIHFVSVVIGCHIHICIYYHTTRQHLIVRDWNVIFVWWQINYEHSFPYLCLSSRSHHLLFVIWWEHVIQKHTNVYIYFCAFKTKVIFFFFLRNFT